MITGMRCSVCKQGCYRDRWGKVLPHTLTVREDGKEPRAEVCPASDFGAKP